MLKSTLLGYFGLVLLTAGAANAQPISYQGSLFDGGVPAAGLYDLECRVFDAVIDGVQLGQTVVIEDLLVSGGLFNAELDFGYAFDAVDVFFEISLRPGASIDLYDVLAPRQRMTSSPKAVHALWADSLTGPQWVDGGTSMWGGEIFKYGNGSNRVLINRDDALMPLEYFGVHSDNEVMGGIVISNSNVLGGTFVSYAADGVIGASHAYEPATESLGFAIGLEKILIVDSAGLSSKGYRFNNPVVQAVTVAGDVFHSSMGTPFNASIISGGAYLTDEGDYAPLVAPISLPHGATITKLVGRFEDNVLSSDLAISLTATKNGGTFLTVASVDSVGLTPFAGIQSVQTTTIVAGEEVVDTFSTGYYIRVFCSSWPGDSSMRVWSVTVEYTVDAPN